MENNLPLGIYSTYEVNIEILHRVDIKVLRNLYCKYYVFREFLSNENIILILTARNRAPDHIKTFELFYIYKMMVKYPEESLIPKYIIERYAIEYDSYELLRNKVRKFLYLPELTSKNKTKILKELNRRYPYYTNAQNGKFPDLNKRNYLGVIYCATLGGYAKEILDHYKDSKIHNTDDDKASYCYCSALCQIYSSDMNMLLEGIYMGNRIWYSHPNVLDNVLYVLVENDNADMISKLIKAGHTTVFKAIVGKPYLSSYNVWSKIGKQLDLCYSVYNGSSLSVIKEIYNNEHNIDSNLLSVIIRSKDIETLRWVLDNKIYDKVKVFKKHISSEISLFEYYQNHSEGIVKLLLSKYDLN